MYLLYNIVSVCHVVYYAQSQGSGLLLFQSTMPLHKVCNFDFSSVVILYRFGRFVLKLRELQQLSASEREIKSNFYKIQNSDNAVLS